MLTKALLNRWTLALFNVLILFPLALTVAELVHLLWGAPWSADMAHSISASEDLIEGLGVVLIGWGVALEERDGVAHLLGGRIDPDDPREAAISQLCHHYGLAQLVLGLFAEIAMECVKLPDHIINTHAIERGPLTLATGFLALGAWCLLAHSVRIGVPSRRSRSPTAGLIRNAPPQHDHRPSARHQQ